ncbi:sodium channel protein 1 brain-like isoform X3 [Convolutriloba macropyga]|uniref:sodium channel protein 1 brain-like isoform X3 n=1 Tax=Convolutriloba macropyga TaxID=536237 RepID=UPI003F524811
MATRKVSNAAVINMENDARPEGVGEESSQQAFLQELTPQALRKLLHPPSAPERARSPAAVAPNRTPSPHRKVSSINNQLDIPDEDSMRSSKISLREQLEKSAISLDDFGVGTQRRKLCGCIPLPGKKVPTRELPEDMLPHPDLEEGKSLPNDYEPFPKELAGKPMIDIDPNRTEHKSFVVISKRMGRNTIYRFSATKAMYFLSPLHPLRRFMMFVATNQWFDALVILCILVNCVFLTFKEPVQLAEYFFQAFYTIEMIIRITARGFCLEKHTYLRDPWNFLDFFVVLIGYVIIILEETQANPQFSFNVAALRTFRVLRALKTISVIPGLRTIVNALLNALKMLAEVMVLMVFCLCVASLLGLQLYMGILRHKCVQNGPTNMTHEQYTNHTNDPQNWQIHVSFDETYQVCGNTTYTGECDANSTCLAVGPNPNWGYTSFDHIGWSLVSSFQLITLDYWENLYDLILMAAGPWNVLFFVILVFFGSFYLINLMLAVVTLSYDEESINVQNEEKEEQESKDRMEKREHDKAAAAMEHSAAANETGGATSGTTAQNKLTPPNAIEASRTSAKSPGSEDGDDDEEDDADGIPDESKPNEGIHVLSLDYDVDLLDEDPEAQMERMNTMWCCGPPCCRTGCCACCGPVQSNKWFPVQLVIYRWVTDPIFDIMVTLLIGVNTIFLALDYHNMPKTLKEVLGWGNQIFTAFFCVEAMLKIIAMGKEYFKNQWNVFDFIIVLFSIVEIIVSAVFDDATFDGLTILRVLRLMRVFKLARSWATMRILLSIIGSTLGALGNLTLILIIIIYIFAVIGMQLLGDGYTEAKWANLTTIANEPSEVPRWNFKDFFHSFMMVFRILCGEWIEALFDCMRVKGEPTCMIIFIATLIVGNFLVLNLFLALLLNKFGQENLKKQKQQQQNTRLKAGWKRLQGLLKKNTRVQPRFLDVLNAAKTGDDDEDPANISPLLRALRQAKAEGKLAEIQEQLEEEFQQLKRQMVPKVVINSPSGEPGNHLESNGTASNGTIQSNGHVAPAFRDPDTQGAFDLLEEMSKNEKGATKSQPRDDSRVSPMKAKALIERKSGKTGLRFSEGTKDGTDGKGKDKQQKKKVNKEEEEKPLEDCLGATLTAKLSCVRSFGNNKWWQRVRRFCFRIVDHRVFEWFILLIILVSSISLAFEDIYLSERPTMEKTLNIMNYVFVAIFTIEMLLKWVGLGFKCYFTNGWCWLDFFIVMVSYTSIITENVLQDDSLAALRSLRTLRALRPLRAISRWQGMKIVVNALASAIPSIFNVLLVCIVFWLIFSIMGVQLMKGRFYACYNTTEELERLGCKNDEGQTITREWCENQNDTLWINQKVNFDNVAIGYLALFQVATFEGWMEIMEAGVDVTKVDEQPCAENSMYLLYPYFVVFIVCGSFFTLNLIIGVIIDNFQTLRRQYDGEGAVDVMLTPSQKNYYQTLKRLAARKPQKTVKRPKNKVMAFFFDISTSTKFEISIAIVILCNMCTMAFDHYDMRDAWVYTLFCLNIMFTTIYTLEALVKIIGLRQQYFMYGWNLFDFFIVLVSIADIIVEALIDSNTIYVKPGTLRVVRLFRIGRVLRLIKAAKGIRKLLFAFLISIPALFNIGCLLGLMLFIYALIGMSLFGYTKHNGMINDKVNFETFFNSMILLFRLMTSGGWNDVLDALMVDENGGCNPQLEEAGLRGDCGMMYLAIPYMVSFLLVNFLIIINMYIAIILENFNNAHQQEEIGITEDDMEMFYQVWQRYDPMATEFIHYLTLPDLLDDLDPPFRLAKPNGIKIVTLRLTINEDENVHCLEILKQLIRYVLQSHSYDSADALKELTDKVEEKFMETFPTLKTQVPKSDTFKRKQEDHAARKIQKAWSFHKFRQTIRRASSSALHSLKIHNLVPLITKNQQMNGALDTSLSNKSHSGSSEDVSVNRHSARANSPNAANHT